MTRSYSSLLTWCALTLVTSLMLYHTSDRVHALDLRLRDLQTQIDAERQSLHVLKAEWVYLANPARVEAATRRHLGLQPTAPARVVALNDIGSLLPVHEGTDPAPVQTADASPAPLPAPTASTGNLSIAALSSAETRTIRAVPVRAPFLAPRSAALASPTDGIGGLIGTLGIRQ